MKTDEHYMKLAIAEAKNSVQAGGAPIGAVMVKDGKVIATGQSLGCASWASLSEIVFGAYKEDAPENPYELAGYHAEEHAKRLTPSSGKKVVVRGGVLRNECAVLMKNIKNWSPVLY